MKHVIVTLSLVLFSSLSSLGQAYHPFIRQGVSWDQVFVDGPGICQFTWGYRAFFSGTTVPVGGQLYHEMRGYAYVSDNPATPGCPPFHLDLTQSSRQALLREDTLTRRVYRHDGQTEWLLYDFAAGVGDTIPDQWGHRVVDSVATVPLLNGPVRRIAYFTNPASDYQLESIGSNFGPLSPSMQIGLGFSYRLEAVWENGVMLWGRPQVPLATAAAVAEAPLTVSLDPTTPALRCRFPAGAGTLRVVDATGRVVLHQALAVGTESVALPAVAPGLYFYELTAAGRRTAGRCLLAD